jgi:hypothetical protein
VVAVTSVGGDRERAFPVLIDGEGAVQAMFLGEGDERARLVLLDPNLRVLGIRALEGAPPDELRGATARHAGERAVEVSGQAPVLLIPGALDLETCVRLIQVLETRGERRDRRRADPLGAPRGRARSGREAAAGPHGCGSGAVAKPDRRGRAPGNAGGSQGVRVPGDAVRGYTTGQLSERRSPSANRKERSTYRLGACEPVCPVKAIFTEDETPEPSKQFIELNKQFFVDNPRVQPCTTKS